jgi:eukaryotic-like serine/threonine-protein kinase
MVYPILFWMGFLIYKKLIKTISLVFFVSLASFCSRIVLRDIDYDNQSWPVYGLNAAHTNFTMQNLTPPLKQAWRHRASSAIGNSIVSIDNSVVYGTKDGKIESININSGKKNGRIKIKGNIPSTVVIYNSNLLIVQNIGQPTFHLYDVKTGKTIWKKKSKGLFAEPIIVKENAIMVDLTGSLISISLVDGSENWRLKLETQSHTTPAYSNGKIIVADDNGIIYAVDESGEIIWDLATSGSFQAHATISDNLVYIGSTDGNLYVVNLNSGNLEWTFDSGAKIYYGAAITKTKVVFGTTGHKVFCLNKKTGKEFWFFEAGSVIGTNPVIAGQVVYFGSLDKNMYAIDLNSGEKIWNFEARGRIISNPIVVQNRLLFASQNDRLYCFEKE